MPDRKGEVEKNGIIKAHHYTIDKLGTEISEELSLSGRRRRQGAKRDWVEVHRASKGIKQGYKEASEEPKEEGNDSSSQP